MELQLKIMLYNMENFFIDGNLPYHSLKKPEAKVESIANIFKEVNPDFALLTEVGGIESLQTFSKKYLSNLYECFLLPGNSDRGIEIGYLVKKQLPYTYQHQSHREREINYQFQGQTLFSTFSRDISELKVFHNQNLKMIFLLVHLKSKWDREGNDPGGSLKREAEVKSLVNLYRDYQRLYPNIPIVVAGDMNGIASQTNFEPEFKAIYESTDLVDIMENLEITDEDRVTYFQFNRDGERFGHQLDYIFLPKKLHNLINKENSGVYRYHLGLTSAFIPPQSIYERASLPSDHYPVIVELNF